MFFIFEGFLFQALSVFSFVCWAAPSPSILPIAPLPAPEHAPEPC